MLVSFIIPIYNTPIDLLRICLKEFIDNKVNDVEVILVDDGSNDEIAAMLDDYPEMDDRFKVFHQENQGVSVARNRGLENSNGKYIVFVDPDDYILPEVMDMDFFENNDNDVILFGFIRKNNVGNERIFSLDNVDINGSRDELIKNVLFCKSIYKDYYGGAIWAKAFRREFLFENGIVFDAALRKAQDRVFMLDSYNKAKKIIISNKCTYVYFENLQSICNSYKPGSCMRSELFAHTVEKRISMLKGFSETNLVIAKTYLELYFEMLYLDIFNIDNKEPFILKRKRAIEKYRDLKIKEKLGGCKKSDCFNMNEIIKYILIKYKMITALYMLIQFRQNKRKRINRG